MKKSNVVSLVLITAMVVTVVSSVGMVSAQATSTGTSQTIDEHGWDNSIALDANGIPNICYRSFTGINYTSQNPDGTWTPETLTSENERNPSLAFNLTGNPYVVYWRYGSGSLFSSRAFLIWKANSGTWSQPDLVDFNPLGGIALALDSASTAHISLSTEDADIRYINCTVNGVKTRETVDSGGFPSLALDATGTPHICYQSLSNPREVRYASRNPNGTWSRELVDTMEYYAAGISLAFDDAGIPHVSYYSAGVGVPSSEYTLQYASRNSDGTWIMEVVNPRFPFSSSSSTTTLAFDIFSVPYILYYNDGHLQYASRNSDGTWNTDVIDLAEDVHNDLAFDDAGIAHISYSYAGALKYFRGILNEPPVAEAGPDLILLVREGGIFNGELSTDVDGTIVSYEWNFGDGNTGNGKSAPHMYPNPGTYTVTLTVTDNKGLTGTDTATITVLTPPQGVDDLKQVLKDMHIRTTLETKLLTILTSAQKLINLGWNKQAVTTLKSFIMTVNYQRGYSLTNDQADALVEYTNRLIASLS